MILPPDFCNVKCAPPVWWPRLLSSTVICFLVSGVVMEFTLLYNTGRLIVGCSTHFQTPQKEPSEIAGDVGNNLHSRLVFPNDHATTTCSHGTLLVPREQGLQTGGPHVLTITQIDQIINALTGTYKQKKLKKIIMPIFSSCWGFHKDVNDILNT